MKNFIFGFVTGGALIGVPVYFITKRRTEIQAQLHIQEMRKEYERKYSPKSVAIQKEEPSKIVEKYEKEVLRYSDRGEAIKADPAEYESPSDDAPEEYYDDDDIDQAAARKESEEAYNYDKMHRNKGHKLISEDEYGQAPGFDSKEVSYYVNDDTYVYDDSDEVIDDPTLPFGPLIRATKWDADDGNTDDICIRNFALSTDYKITKNFCAYELEQN